MSQQMGSAISRLSDINLWNNLFVSGFKQTMRVQMKQVNINLTFENGSIDLDLQAQ